MRHLKEAAIDQETMGCIRTFIKDHSYPPTFEELRICLKLASKSSVQHRLKRLVEAGLIVMEPSQPRTIRIVKGKQ